MTEIDEKALEAVAEALWQADSERAAGRRRLSAWTDEGPKTQSEWRFNARAAISAYEAAKGDGWLDTPAPPVGSGGRLADANTNPSPPEPSP